MEWFIANQTPFYLFLLQWAFHLSISSKAIPILLSVYSAWALRESYISHPPMALALLPECVSSMLSALKENPVSQSGLKLNVEHVDS